MSQPLDEYKNLTKDELEWADHCFETGNRHDLRKLRELSESRKSSGGFRTDPRRL